MTVKFTKSFETYLAAASWLEEHGYTESVIELGNGSGARVTLEGAHAVRAIEAATKTKVVIPEVAYHE